MPDTPPLPSLPPRRARPEARPRRWGRALVRRWGRALVRRGPAPAAAALGGAPAAGTEPGGGTGGGASPDTLRTLTLQTLTRPRPVVARWDVRDGRPRLRWERGDAAMTFGEAKALLLVHRGGGPALGHRTGRRGPLGPLRPHGGRLDEAYFHQLMAAVVAVAPHLRGEARVDRALVAALWDLCASAWQWASEPDGSRRPPGCVADAERVVLAGRLEAISSAVSVLLGGGPLEDALASYRRLAGAAGHPPPPGA